MGDLKQAVAEIKKAILSSQYQAAKMTNTFQLSLYFSIGKYVSENTRNKNWGSGAIENISEQLQRELPGLRGFSAENIKKMRTFYEAWNTMLVKSDNSVATATELPNNSNIDIYTLVDTNRSPLATEFNLQEFLSLGFSLHMEILHKAKTQDARIFYIHQAAVNSWGKYELRDYLKADVYNSQGKLPNNVTI